MADGLTLQGALSGMTVSPMESYYGIGTQALGQALPSLVNPYGNFGTNLTYVLGGALLQGLLGYQARQEANRQNLEIGRLAAQMSALPTAADRVDFLSNVNADSQVMDRLTKLQSALQGQETLSNAAIQQQIAQKKALAPIEAEIQQAAERGMTPDEYAAAKPQLEQLRKLRLAQALSGATTPQQTVEAASELTAKDLFKRADAMRPTENDRLAFGEKIYKQKLDESNALRIQGNSLLQLEKESRVADTQKALAEANLKGVERKNIEDARSSKPLLKVTDMVTETNKLRAQADQMMAAIKANPDDEIGISDKVQKLVTAANRIIEDNQTTLGELEKVENTQPLVTRLKNNLGFQVGAGAKYDEKLIRSLYNYVVDGQQAIADLYARQRDKTAQVYGVPPETIDIADVYTVPPVGSTSAAFEAPLITKLRAKMVEKGIVDRAAQDALLQQMRSKL